MNPYIAVTVVQTLETIQTKKELLQYIKARFEETHQTIGSWQGDESDPILHLAYPSKEAFQAGYSWGMGVVEKILQLDQEGHDIQNVEWFPKDEPQIHPDESSEENSEIYLTLKYRTNWKTPMRGNYLINRKMAQILGTKFYVEEIEDGFLIMYKRKIDFEFAQINRMNFESVLNWIVKNNIDENHPIIQNLLAYLKNYSEKSA